MKSVARFPEFQTKDLMRLIDHHGYVYINAVPDSFDHVDLLNNLGPLVPQYDGDLIWSIKAHERFDNLYHSLNTKALLPHTECYEYPGTPPKYLALWCLVPCSDSGGQTLLANLRSFVDGLSSEEYRRLTVDEYNFVSSAGVQDMALGRRARHPVMEVREPRSPIIRFSYNCIEHRNDPFMLDMRERIVEFFNHAHTAIKMEKNSILIWDNHSVAHARTAYTDRRRHLRRAWLGEV